MVASIFYTCNVKDAEKMGQFPVRIFYFRSNMAQLKKLKETLKSLFDLKNIDTSDLEWIMVYVLKISRRELAIDRELTVGQIKEIYRLAKKRFKGIPLSQVLGQVDFYGLNFYVNKNVLSPRPETELLVEEILKDFSGGIGLDIGTGSGAIAITLNRLNGLKMIGVDISKKALRVARKNNKELGTDVVFLKSDLFNSVGEKKFNFIVSNPPYIKSEDIKFLDAEVKDYEPKLALDGGEDGLDFYKKIIVQASKHLIDGGKIFFEIGINQSEAIKELLQEDFDNIEIIKDYNNIDRIIKAVKK